MLKFLAGKLLQSVLTLAMAMVLIFAGTELLPGDLAASVLQNNATPETLAVMRAQLHLDRPASERFGQWALGFVQGDLGQSLTNGRAVADEVGPRLKNTLFLAAYAASVAVPLALVLGIASALFQGRIFDRATSVASLIAISVPEYFLGYILIKTLAVDWGLFPSLANVDETTPFGSRLVLTFLPMLTLVLVILAHMMRMTRASLLNILQQPYIEMARLKGMSDRRVLLIHALPNAFAPIVNVIALNLAYLVVGVVVVEAVFVYPGLGQLMVDAVGKHDVPVVQACGLIFAISFIGLNLIADMITVIANPRLRRQSR
jgi:peptide/nickel transport system permease protein